MKSEKSLMTRILWLLFPILPHLGYTQDISTPTLILPTSTGQSLEDPENTSKRYTVKPAPPRPKFKEAKKQEEAVTPPQAQSPKPAVAVTKEIPEPEVTAPVTAPESPNHLDIWIYPSFIYSDFKSNYWFRNYNLASPGLNVGTSVWLSQNFGFNCSYITTMGAEIAGSPNDYSRIAVSQQWFNFSLQFREYDPESPKRQLIYGLKYFDYQFQVPLESQFRSRLKTSGLSLFFRIMSPANPRRVNTFEVEISPQAKHKEIQTSINLNSGDKVDTNGVALSFGQMFKIMNANHMSWSLKASIEKNVFTGTANAVDPVTNQTPTGVVVTNSTLMLNFGYTWSN